MRVLLPLALLVATPAWATPFNAYGHRMDPGTLGFNPYVGADFGEAPWGSLFLFYGVTPWLDVAVAANGLLVEGRPELDSWEVVPRFFPSPDLELALAGHLTGAPDGSLVLGPELHLAGFPTPAVGLWVNVGARYDIAGEPSDSDVLAPRGGRAAETFAWFAAEVTDDVPFFAFEVDLESAGGEVDITLIPSVGAWVGKKRETGISVGWLLQVGRPEPGVGLWVWRTIDLRGEGRRRRNRPALEGGAADATASLAR